MFFFLKLTIALALLIFIWHLRKPAADSGGLRETGLIQTKVIT